MGNKEIWAKVYNNKPFKRVIKNKGRIGATLGETDLDKKVVVINRKAHGKNKKKSDNRLINTIVHEEYHIKHPKATEKTTYKATKAKNIKKLTKKQKQKLYNKYRFK